MKFGFGWALVFFFIPVTGCNLFSFVDSPSGDIQLLSAARSALDRGDYASASKYYGLISSASSDQVTSESAFEILAQNGMTISVFMTAVLAASTNSGKLVTRLSQSLIGNAGSTARLNIFHAYQKVLLINNSKLRGLVRFITSLTLIAELLAEDANSSTQLLQTDLVLSPTSCLAAYPAFYLSASCGKPTNSKLISGSSSITLSTATDSQMSGSPSLFMISAALNEISTGTSEMGSSGTLGSSSSTFASVLTVAGQTIAADPDESPEFRGALIYYGVGE